MLQGLGKQMGIQDLLTVLCVQEEFSYSYTQTHRRTPEISRSSVFFLELLSLLYSTLLSRNSLEFLRVSDHGSLTLAHEKELAEVVPRLAFENPN